MKQCAKCGYPCDDTANYCPQCGSKLSSSGSKENFQDAKKSILENGAKVYTEGKRILEKHGGKAYEESKKFLEEHGGKAYEESKKFLEEHGGKAYEESKKFLEEKGGKAFHEGKHFVQTNNVLVGWISCFAVVILLSVWIVSGFWTFLLTSFLCFIAVCFLSVVLNFELGKSPKYVYGLISVFILISIGKCFLFDKHHTYSSSIATDNYNASSLDELDYSNYIGTWKARMPAGGAVILVLQNGGYATIRAEGVGSLEYGTYKPKYGGIDFKFPTWGSGSMMKIDDRLIMPSGIEMHRVGL